MASEKYAYLLSWNPGMFRQGGDGNSDKKLDIKVGETKRWSCTSKHPKVGDDIYMVRLGMEPRGIFLKGVVTKESFQAEDWNDSQKKRNYIEFEVQELRLSCNEGLLPMVLLKKGIPEQIWTTQTSGIEIKQGFTQTLQLLWESGKNKHSLKQFVDWVCAEVFEKKNKEWLANYTEITGLVRDIIEKKHDLNDDDLLELWGKDSNGITSVGQGALPKIEFNDNKDLLRTLTNEIFANPTKDAYESILRLWNEAIENKKFSKIRWSVINRVFSARAPNLYTTIISEKNCKTLISYFVKNFEFKVKPADSWIENNATIKQCMELAKLDANRTLENNMAMWQLFDALTYNSEASTKTTAETTPEKQVKIDLPTNQILYGPPGTGKTYNTINEALQILEPDLIYNTDIKREDLIAAFNRYKQAGQIVFCTFHQSFSYEDFVEGLRASTVNGVINYAIEKGIFKELCERARQGTTATEDPFSDALNKLKKMCEEADERLILETKTGKKFGIEYEGGVTFKLYPESTKNKNTNYVANIDHVRKLYFTDDKSNTYNTSYVEGLLTFLKKKCGLPDLPITATTEIQQRKYVLIIDEINRGNISKIFGELISLIEPSKRSDQPEALSVILPYSKEDFSVPSNVYLIGTMNTADRSLAGLDIALRRRFTFKEMPPQYDELSQKTVQDINIGQLLQVMNERIKVLLDSDHCLGHAYFIGLEKEDSLANLSSIFKMQILPLLQEYFFEDWERIAWVLNDQNKHDDHAFVTKNSVVAKSLFGAKGPDNLQNENKCWRINLEAFKNIESYRQIIKVVA